jgi:hypothetical protein
MRPIKQHLRPLTPAGIKIRAERMREQCDAIRAYASALAEGAPDEHPGEPSLSHLIQRTAKRLSFAARDLSERA